MKSEEQMIKEATDRGFLVVESSEDKALADRLVRERKLDPVVAGKSGTKHYRLAPPPKEKRNFTCKCGVKFKAWTAGACGRCKAKK